MCGPIFIYYRWALRLYGCMRTFTHITLQDVIEEKDEKNGAGIEIHNNNLFSKQVEDTISM